MPHPAFVPHGVGTCAHVNGPPTTHFFPGFRLTPRIHGQHAKPSVLRAVLDHEDEEPYFSPLEGNVAFASAFDGWAFQTHHFAALSAPKLGISQQEVQQGLWGAFYFSPKRRAVLPIKAEQAHKLTPLFVQVCLEGCFASVGPLGSGLSACH